MHGQWHDAVQQDRRHLDGNQTVTTAKVYNVLDFLSVYFASLIDRAYRRLWGTGTGYSCNGTTQQLFCWAAFFNLDFQITG